MVELLSNNCKIKAAVCFAMPVRFLAKDYPLVKEISVVFTTVP